MPDVKLPKTVEEMYAKADGNKFASINRPTAGARDDVELPKGEKPIQLYSLATPNGMKVAIALEEMGLEYDAFRIDIGKGQQFGKGFVDVNPNSKIPCMVDTKPDFGGEPVSVFETASILIYLAEKTGKFLPKDPRARTETLNWLMWQQGSQGPYFGQFGHFYKYAPRDKAETIEYGVARYGMEAQRLLDVLDKRLADRKFVAGDEVTIADFAIMPWVGCIDFGYNASEFLGLAKYKNVERYMKEMGERPAVQRGFKVTPF